MNADRFLIACLLVASCASAPSVPEIDNGLLVEVSSEARASIGAARTARDEAGDRHSATRSATRRSGQSLDAARAALKTLLSQAEESEIALEVARSGAPAQLERANANHTHSLAKAEHGTQLVAVREFEFKLAELKEALALEEHRLSVAVVEVEKAEALQGVELVAAEGIPIEDYWKQAAYHREKAQAARRRVQAAEADVREAQATLDEIARRVQRLVPQD